MENSEKYKSVLRIGDKVLDFDTKFININYDELGEEIKAQKDSLDTYSYLVKLYNQHLLLARKTEDELSDKIRQEAFNMALADCKKMGLYLDIFDREEFRTMMIEQLSYEEVLDYQYEVGVNIGREEGEKRGIALGEKRGMALGEKRGKIIGLLMAGMDTNKIMELTEASEEEILDIKKNLN